MLILITIILLDLLMDLIIEMVDRLELSERFNNGGDLVEDRSSQGLLVVDGYHFIVGYFEL